jgi:hypothetical protein
MPNFAAAPVGPDTNPRAASRKVLLDHLLFLLYEVGDQLLKVIDPRTNSRHRSEYRHSLLALDGRRKEGKVVDD